MFLKLLPLLQGTLRPHLHLLPALLSLVSLLPVLLPQRPSCKHQNHLPETYLTLSSACPASNALQWLCVVNQRGSLAVIIQAFHIMFGSVAVFYVTCNVHYRYILTITSLLEFLCILLSLMRLTG